MAELTLAQRPCGVPYRHYVVADDGLIFSVLAATVEGANQRITDVVCATSPWLVLKMSTQSRDSRSVVAALRP